MAVLTPSKNLKPAKRYAKALIELALDTSNAKDCISVDKIYDDFSFCLQAINENKELKDFLFAPPVSKEDKKDVLEKIFEGKIDNRILNFLFLLNENSRLEISDEILGALKKYIDEEKNILNVDIISAVEMNDVQKEALKSKLQNKTGKVINPKYSIDKGILGGLIIKIDDTVIDLSLIKRIENLRK